MLCSTREEHIVTKFDAAAVAPLQPFLAPRPISPLSELLLAPLLVLLYPFLEHVNVLVNSTPKVG